MTWNRMHIGAGRARPVRRLLVVLVLTGLALSGGPVRAGAQESTTASPYTRSNQLDLNRASLEEIGKLPIPGKLALEIFNFREDRKLFDSIYDLMDVPGMTPEALAAIRDRVKVAPKFEVLQDAQEDERLENLAYLAQRFLSQEGSAEGLVDEYVDLLKTPRNVNDMDYFGLTTIQNVSPIDAVAILKARREKPFESTQELRRTDGLSYYGYRNLRDFIRFDDDGGKRLRVSGDYQFRVYNTPYQLDDTDILADQLGASQSDNIDGPKVRNENDLFDLSKNSLSGRLNIDQSRPYTTNKVRLRIGPDLKTGLITHRNMGEKNLDETLKWYAGVDGQQAGRLKIHHAYVGNYRVAIGQGLVMDNTDFFQSRTTGYGFRVRPVGIRGDLSRSDEYALKGGAFEASWGPIRGIGFYSNDDKDAILNPDGSFNRYVTMLPRVDNETLAEIRQFVRVADSTRFLPMRDVMNEKVLGGNLKYEFTPGVYVGLTAMEMKYRNNAFSDSTAQFFNPDPTNLIIENARVEGRDSDLGEAYDNRGLGTFRDIVGAETGIVYRNIHLQGEYGKLATSARENFASRALHNGPEAWIGSAYLQYENFNFLALYRDYDLGYDNPYNRAFAERNRYDQTLTGDEFRLYNPLFSFLAENDSQSAAERGFYFTTRYQLTRNFTINYLEYDNYYRKTDNTDQQRVTLSVEYRPIFPVRIRVRQRYSDRDGKGRDDARDFKGWDSRFEGRFYLSNFDRLDFLYSTTTVIFGPRPRLSNSAVPPVPPPGFGELSTDLGTRSIPAQAFEARFTRNWSSNLSTTLSSEIYDGFLFNFEDNEFIAFDGKGFRNWFLVRSRMSNELSWRLKYTVDFQDPVTWIDIRNFGGAFGDTPEGRNGKQTVNSFRFQLDYSF